MNIGKFSLGILFSHGEAPFENLLPNQRFGFETAPSRTVSTSDTHYIDSHKDRPVSAAFEISKPAISKVTKSIHDKKSPVNRFLEKNCKLANFCKKSTKNCIGFSAFFRGVSGAHFLIFYTSPEGVAHARFFTFYKKKDRFMAKITRFSP